MKELIVYLGAAAPETVSWLERDGKEIGPHQQGALSELTRLKSGRIYILIPGGDVLLTEVALPAGRRRIGLKSLPYLLEENLAEDVESLHFAVGPADRQNKLPVAVVARDRMDHWLSMLLEAGLDGAVLVPAPLALPYQEGTWTGLLTEDMLQVRTGIHQGFSVDRDNIELVWELIRPQIPTATDETLPLLRLQTSTPEDLSDLFPGVRVETITNDHPITTLAQGFQASQTIDLLQGPYSRHAEWQEVWRQWRQPLLLLLVLVAMVGAGMILNFSRLRHEDLALEAAIINAYRESFPEAKKVINARIQMENQLKAFQDRATRRDDFLETYAQIAPLLNEAVGFTLKGFRYRNGRFDYDLEVDNLQILEELKGQLSALPGIGVEIRNAAASGDKLAAKLQIKGGEQ
ncbi:MAG: type II secretion system protein GspL [Proteobacteria bacterium]|nr:type II secretion system protein GspL [Pseudomonadota bacterium]MBU1686374.1 type II secretion system protein GspL [Pseudomonadota bacterium]